MYPTTLIDKTTELVTRLTDVSRNISVAESCTGGLLGGLITSVAGASNVFSQGFITYSNEAKTQLLGVEEALLNTHGAVSEPVAIAMAEGALKVAEADIALAITGIAGPGGGTEEKPVGLVFIACASHQGMTCNKHLFSGNREQVRLQSCEQAVELALDYL